MISQLGYDYHALVTMIVLHVSKYSIYQGNQSRDYQVPKDVVHSQIESLEWIEDSEAHRIAFINQEGFLDFRGACNSCSFSY